MKFKTTYADFKNSAWTFCVLLKHHTIFFKAWLSKDFLVKLISRLSRTCGVGVCGFRAVGSCGCLKHLSAESVHQYLCNTVFVPAHLFDVLRPKISYFLVVRTKHSKRIARVLRCSEACRVHSRFALAVSLSPDLYFALELESDEPVQISLLDSQCTFWNIVRVCLIRSPNYLPASSTENALKAYFSEPKVIYPGDIFCAQNPDACWDVCASSTCPTSFWFKVESTEGSGAFTQCLVQKDVSTLYQLAAVNSKITTGLSNSSKMDLWHLPSMRPYWQDLVKYLIGTAKWNLAYPTEALAVVALVQGPSGSGKATMVHKAASEVGWHVLEANGFEIWSENRRTMEKKLHSLIQRTAKNHPCVLLLRHINWLGANRVTGEQDHVPYSFLFQCLEETVRECQCSMIIAGTVCEEQLPREFLGRVLLRIEAPLLSEDNVVQILENLYVSHYAGFSFRFEKPLIQSLSRMPISDLMFIVERALYWSSSESQSQPGSNVSLDMLQKSIDEYKRLIGKHFGRPEVPNVNWRDIGGLEEVKQTIIDTIQLSLDRPEVFLTGLRPCGLVMYGPPGCGKTLLAKAVATECSLNFLSVKGPELLNMYVGQSEENIRNIFTKARKAAPAVIFFDELDSLAPNRGRSGDSGGVMDRVVSQLLAELDSVDENQAVFVIGATNRPDLIDPALIRPGRFDKSVYVGIAQGEEDRLKILQACANELNLQAGLNLSELVHMCPRQYTGADFQALCTEANLTAVGRIIEALEAGDSVVQNEVESGHINITVEKGDFFHALSVVKPSISASEMLKYDSLRKQQ